MVLIDIFRIYMLFKYRRIHHPARRVDSFSIKIDGEIKSFSDKQSLREFRTTKSALQQMLKRHIVKKYKRRKKIYKIKL